MSKQLGAARYASRYAFSHSVLLRQASSGLLVSFIIRLDGRPPAQDKVYLIRYIPFGDSESDLLEAHPEALESNLNRRNDGVLDRSAVVELSFAVPDQSAL
ncbi:hypothetical protein T265_01267 [Opisthorchis viverrini]|uniref:Uncharacterized protein n=1 Tax=Opisthorchis viverrini TaxID=6198 RepID=A0A075AAI7_OPIVI|nr:hypothetical protein T265_01267 [Opisthorchis viverrini]KER32790.1 hypothetical protein T265_01267 [Opisthorchis viverrini]